MLARAIVLAGGAGLVVWLATRPSEAERAAALAEVTNADLQRRLALIEAQKAQCSGRRLQVKRCKKRYDKEKKKLFAEARGGGFQAGADAFGGLIGAVGEGVGDAASGIAEIYGAGAGS